MRSCSLKKIFLESLILWRVWRNDTKSPCLMDTRTLFLDCFHYSSCPSIPSDNLDRSLLLFLFIIILQIIRSLEFENKWSNTICPAPKKPLATWGSFHRNKNGGLLRHLVDILRNGKVFVFIVSSRVVSNVTKISLARVFLEQSHTCSLYDFWQAL